MKYVLFSVFFFLSMTLGAVADQNDEWLTLGVVPYKSPRAIVELYGPVANILAKELGRNVRVVTATGFDQYLQRIYSKQYDIIVLGSTFYFMAHDRAGYEVIARGYPPFRCGIIVREESDIETIEQLRGKSMAAVNIMDRGGYKLQKRALLRAGIDLKHDLDIHFRGKHDSVIYAVLNGQDDAGAIRLDSLQKTAFVGLRKKIRIIYTSLENPQFPFAVRQGMDPVMRAQIGAALASITLKHPETAAILNELHLQGISLITNRELEILRKKRQEDLQQMDL